MRRKGSSQKWRGIRELCTRLGVYLRLLLSRSNERFCPRTYVNAFSFFLFAYLNILTVARYREKVRYL